MITELYVHQQMERYLLKNSVYTALVFSVVISFIVYKRYILEDHFYIYVNSNQPVFYTDEKFLSVALDTSFMRCSFHEMNDSDWRKLKELSSLLSPSYLRLGGTEADHVIFRKSVDESKSSINHSKRCVNHIPNKPLIITGKDWIRINQFAEKSKLSFIFDFNVLLRTRSKWNSSNARLVLRFSEEMGFPMDFQLGNEPNSFRHVFNLSVSGRQLAEDFDELKGILKSTKGYRNSKLIGPDVTRPKNLEVPSLEYLEEFLRNTNSVDVVSWHQYYLNGRIADLKDFVNPNTFDVLPPQIEAVVGVVRKFSKTVPIWISETSSAYGDGAPGLSDRFAASFLWLDKLGVSAKNGMSVVVRQSLLKGNYALIDEEFSPSPDFWISFFYKNLVGNKVLNITCQSSKEICKYLRFYGHCLLSNSPVKGNMVIFGMNLLNETKTIVPLGIKINNPIYSFIFSAENGCLKSKSVFMNGKKLIYEKSVYDLFKRKNEVKLPLTLAPYSIGFWILNEIEDSGCDKL